jgi:[protein-PII] uridylyltransferase
MSQHRYDIPDRRGVISRKALIEVLAGEATERSGESQRLRLLREFKLILAAGQQEVTTRLKSGQATGLQAAHANAYLIDQMIRVLYDFTVEQVYPLGNPTASERMAIVATGGFGRGEMAPYSDVDLMILIPYKAAPWVESVAEYMLYILWDLGLKVGHAIRSGKDAIHLAKKDLSTRTALLDARFIWGDLALFTRFSKDFKKQVVAKGGEAFVEEKLAERQARHERMGNSRYVVEPNLKEGKGGLRDLQTIFWIARFLFGHERIAGLVKEGVLTRHELQLYHKAEDFFWTVRCHLHLIAGRATEQLSFDVQSDLAAALKYRDHPGLSGVERFMKHYFLMAKQVGDLTRVFCADLQERQKMKTIFRMSRFSPRRRVGDFRLEGDWLTLRRKKDFEKDPVKMIEIFAVADRFGYDLHPDALHQITSNLKKINGKVRRDARACELFLEVLTSNRTPETSLRRMNEAGVFGRFIPDFGRIVAQMQHDMYHHYTVDEHTIRAIGLLSQIEKGELAEEHPIATGVMRELSSRRALYVAVMLHDIAKGRGGDHSVLGAGIAERLCPRLGLSEAETELVSWLVRYHLIMSSTAFKRDLADPKTIKDFVDLVKSPERLRLLTALTVVDIRAVGPGVWNSWKRQLITDLYFLAEESLVVGHVEVGRVQRLKTQKQAWRASVGDWSAEKIKAFERRFRDGYWLSEDKASLGRNARMIDQADISGAAFSVDFFVEPGSGTTAVTVYAKDRVGLFSMLSGALAELGINILGAKIHTTFDGMALDSFAVQGGDGKAISQKAKLKRLEATLRAWASEADDRSGKIIRKEVVPSRRDVFKVAPFVIFDNKASARHTLLEINARDRRGLLYDLTQVLYKNKVSVVSAHVATYGERAVDVFYVQELDGWKISNKKRLLSLEEKLIAATKAA